MSIHRSCIECSKIFQFQKIWIKNTRQNAMKIAITLLLTSGFKLIWSTGLINIPFSVKLLTMGSWPYNQTFTMEIPKVFEETLNNFTTFYHEKHTGRTLTWLYSQSKVFPVITLVEIKCVFPMVVVSILPHAEFGLNDHREGALYLIRKTTIKHEFYLGWNDCDV